MLTSQSVSPNILPGLIKAIEKYILIYNTDEVLKHAGGASAGQIISTGAQLAMAGAALLAGEDNTEKPGEQISEAPTWDQMQAKERLKQKAANVGKTAGAIDQASQAVSKSSRPATLDFPRGESVSLEPTYVQVTTKKKGLQILGVKVIPFRVKTNENMAGMILNDKDLKGLSFLQQKYGRKIARVYFRIMRKIIPAIKEKVISGNPQKDVIYASSRYGKDMFVCMSQLDLDSEEEFSNPAAVQKLHRLGWASFIVTDDVTKRATFCMKEFGGVCSVVPYAFMFSSLGKEHSKVYEDLEDVKKTSGPFFNMRTNRRRMFSEVKSTTDKYLELIQK
jgi:hypothetical protein